MNRRAGLTRRLASEQLESRHLMAAAVTLDADHVLHLEGTSGNDTILIETTVIRNSTSGLGLFAIHASVRDQDGHVVEGTFPMAAVDQIMVECLRGDDHATNNTAKPSTMHGGLGWDTLSGGSGPDKLYGSDSYDGTELDGTLNLLQGNGGNDELYAGRTGDILDGGDGDDKLYGGSGEDSLWGGADQDFIQGGPGDDQISGGGGNDILYGEDGNDQIWGDGGNDKVHGGNGDDTCMGGAGTDLVTGGEGWDSLWGDDYNANNSNTIDTIYFDLLDSADGNWGSLIYGFSPKVVEGAFKGFGVYKG